LIRCYHKIETGLTTIELCMDVDSKEMAKFLCISKNKKKLKVILHCIERRINNKELYEVYKIGTGNVSAIKFTRGKENARIYCQIQKGTSEGEPARIIMAEFIHKKTSQGLSKTLINRLKAISKYEYEHFRIVD